MKVSVSDENIEIVTTLEINELQEKNSSGAGAESNPHPRDVLPLYDSPEAVVFVGIDLFPAAEQGQKR